MVTRAVIRAVRRHRLVALALAGLAAVVLVLAASSQPAGAQGDPSVPCSIDYELDGDQLSVVVSPHPNLSFVQPPGFDVWVLDDRGHVIEMASVPHGQVGSVDFDVTGWPAGTYEIRGLLIGACSASLVLVPDATATPGPSASGTPQPTSEPDPDPTSVPEPTSTPQPEPTAVPEPEPTPEPTPEPPPVATPIPEPTATPVPVPTATPTSPPDEVLGTTSVPEPTPTIEDPDGSDDGPSTVDDPAGPPSDGDLDPGVFEPNPSVVPGTMETTWVDPMIVGQTATIEVALIGADWRPDAAEMFGDEIAIVEVSNGRKSNTIAIYGAEGPIAITIEIADTDLVRLADGEPATKTTRFRANRRNAVSWRVLALDDGLAGFTISADRADQAIPQSPLDDAELAATNVDDLHLVLPLEIQVSERVYWLGFRWWQALPLLLLPWLPIGDLFRASGRRGPGPSADPDGDGPGSGGPKAPVLDPSAGSSGGVALAFSGGGLRATAFSLGVAMYLSEVGVWPQVRQIASVSGGSLANAYIGRRSSELGSAPTSAADLESMASAVAHRGLPVERSGRLLALAIAAGWAWIAGVTIWAAPSVTAALPWVVVAGAIFAFICWLTFVWLGLRPALRRWIPNLIGLPENLRLAELGIGSSQPIDHIFTANTNRSDRVHLAQRQMIIAPPHVPAELAESDQAPVTGFPLDLSVAQAVQASAAFPGLPRVTLDGSTAGFAAWPGKLVLRDGGTSNNLGHIGETLFEPIDPQVSAFLTAHGAIDRWIVVDSSAHRFTRAPRPGWLVGLLNTLNLGVAADIAEMAGTAQAEHTAEAAARIKRHFADTGTGVYIGLRDSPFDAARQVLFQGSQADHQAADQAVAHLLRHGIIPAGYDPTEAAKRSACTVLERLAGAANPAPAQPLWETARVENSGVATTLSSLGTRRTVALVHHGYVLAAVQCHIVFGWPLPTTGSMRVDRFDDITTIDPLVDLATSPHPATAAS